MTRSSLQLIERVVAWARASGMPRDASPLYLFASYREANRTKRDRRGGDRHRRAAQ